MRKGVMWRVKALAVAAFLAGMGPLTALADDTKPKVYDDRLEIFSKPVTLDNSGTGLVWLLLIGLAVLTLIVLFKHARRTHLD